MNLANARTLLQKFDFTSLFVEELGWSNPSSGKSVPMSVKGIAFNRREIAQLSGVVVIEVVSDDGSVPDAAGRAAIHKEIAKLHHENVLIFVDAKRSQTARELVEASGCDLVLSVWDLKPYWDPATGRSCEDETREMLNTLAGLPAATRRRVKLLCLTWEIETWLIADHRAVREHLSTDAHKERKFRCSNPLGKADAKAFLISEFKEVRGKSGRYVDYREAIQIARLMPDTRMLQGIHSFTRFARVVGGNTNADFQRCGDVCNDLVYHARRLGRV